LGRTTFIVLEKVQHLTEKLNANLKIPENTERLIDLIRVKDKKFLPAFYFGLHDTLVTKDLATATKSELLIFVYYLILFFCFEYLTFFAIESHLDQIHDGVL
jgi:hypothetical protein